MDERDLSQLRHDAARFRSADLIVLFGSVVRGEALPSSAVRSIAAIDAFTRLLLMQRRVNRAGIAVPERVFVTDAETYANAIRRRGRAGQEQWVLYFARALAAALREAWKQIETVSDQLERRPGLDAASVSERQQTIYELLLRKRQASSAEVAEALGERCWQWLFHGEAASLLFSAGYDDVPVERRPIILGRIRFPKNGGMTLQTNSILRAIEAARFFGPRLGPQVVAMRCRVVNRCFAAEEGQHDDLMKTLDQNVSVIDPRVAELAFERELKGRPRPRTMQEVERAATESLQRRIKSKKDVPLVEDYPLHPEEETSEFRDLATGLQFRAARALEHWNGNTHLTLTAIIVRAVEQGMGARDQQRQGT